MFTITPEERQADKALARATKAMADARAAMKAAKKMCSLAKREEWSDKHEAEWRRCEGIVAGVVG